MTRRADLHRKTSETDIRVAVNLDGTGQARVETPIGFLTHMVEQIARHGSSTWTWWPRATSTSTGTTPPKTWPSRWARPWPRRWATSAASAAMARPRCPWTRRCMTCALDLSGRPYFVWRVPMPKAKLGGFDTELAEVFFEGFVRGAQCNLHMRLHEGENLHHIIEIGFKAFAKALREATEIDPRQSGVPSTKGTLTE
jgi:imidazoleglycerol-phosphate dehydratase